MRTIEARVTKNIKEDPSSEECDIWNIEATFLDPLPDDTMRITANPGEIGVNQLEAARTDSARTSITIRTQRKSRLSLVRSFTLASSNILRQSRCLGESVGFTAGI
jgi:hypothetical protein